MKVVYEATDAVINYGLLNAGSNDTSPWTTYFMSGPSPGHGGLVIQDTKPTARRAASRPGSYAQISFYGALDSSTRRIELAPLTWSSGTSCTVIGMFANLELEVQLDGQHVDFEDNHTDSEVLELPVAVYGLSQGWHTLQVTIRNSATLSSALSITRVEFETGLSEYVFGLEIEDVADCTPVTACTGLQHHTPPILNFGGMTAHGRYEMSICRDLILSQPARETTGTPPVW